MLSSICRDPGPRRCDSNELSLRTTCTSRALTSLAQVPARSWPRPPRRAEVSKLAAVKDLPPSAMPASWPRRIADQRADFDNVCSRNHARM